MAEIERSQTGWRVSCDDQSFWSRLDTHPVGFRIVTFALVFAGLGLISIWFSRMAGSAAVLWLPNALATVLLLTSERQRVVEIFASHGLGVVIANAVFGDSLTLLFAFCVVNFIEVFVAHRLYVRVVGHRWPHESEDIYLRFIGFTVIVSCLSSVFGGTLLHLAFGAPLPIAYVEWFVGTSVSLCAFIPLFLWTRLGAGMGYIITRKNTLWTCVCIGLAFLVVLFVIVSHEEVSGFFLLVLVFSGAALRTGRVGVMIASATLATMLSITKFFGDGSLLSPEALGFADSLATAYAAVYFCIALPANLIAAMVERLQLAEARQRELVELKDGFIASMSHETLTPLNVISGALQLINRRDDDEKLTRLSAMAMTAAETLTNQTKQILTMSVLQDGQLRLDTRSLSVRSLFDQWVAMTQVEIDASGKPIELNVDHGDLDETVRADEYRVIQIFLNLSSNAVKFSERGTITLSVRRVSQSICFTIQDEGCGLSEEDMAHVFVRFWQADSGHARKFGGAGIGLSVCKQLAEAMQGDVTVTSKFGEGTRFELVLPQAT